MGNSTRTLQQVVDSTSTIGDLNPVLVGTGGYASEPAVTIANLVHGGMLASPFPWKFNRVKVAPFWLNANQQDYAGINLINIGWLEEAAAVDQNSTTFPKPTYPVEVVQTLSMSSYAGGRVGQMCAYQNKQMEQGDWPGAGVTYADPSVTIQTPANPPTNILDANGNILVLTAYGTTAVRPLAAAGAAAGATVADGTCTWTVANPNGYGFRVFPRPSAGAIAWLMRVFAQAKPPRFIGLGGTLDPIPDDYSQWWEDGFIAFCHRYSANPKVQAKFPGMRQVWLESLAKASGQADREVRSLRFTSERGVIDRAWGYGPTGDNPLNWRPR